MLFFCVKDELCFLNVRGLSALCVFFKHTHRHKKEEEEEEPKRNNNGGPMDEAH